MIQPPLTRLTTDRSIGYMPETCIKHDHTIRQKIKTGQVPFYPDLLINPPPRLPDIKTYDNRSTTLDVDLDINKDFEENSLYQEGIISETYQRPDKSQLLEPPELADLINTNNLVQKYLPKQTDLDKILKIIQGKVLKGTHLPVRIREIQVGYLNSPYFKGIYLYLAQNKLPSSKSNIHKVEVLAERYIFVRFITVQTDHNPRQENCIIGNTRNMCRQDHYTLSFKSFCRTSRCNKDILDNSRQILYTRFYALLTFLYKRLPRMPIDQKG